MLKRQMKRLRHTIEVIERFGDSDELEVKEQVADTFSTRPLALEQNNQNEAAIALYDQLVHRTVMRRKWNCKSV